MLKKYWWIILGLIIFGAFLVRLHRFNNPIADWHSWRQSDTSAVSIFLISDHYDLLHPRFYDISNIPSQKENNPHGYRFVEFPIYNILQAGSYQLFDYFTIEEWGRIVTILGSLASIFFLYKLFLKHENQISAFVIAFFFAFLPFSIYYGRTILPDQLMVTATLGGIYFFDIWTEENSNHKPQSSKPKRTAQTFGFYMLSLIFTASALLLKPYAVFFLIPVAYLAYRRFGWKMILRWELWVFGVLAITPLASWRLWIRQYPEGIPASNWLFNGGNVRFKPYFFRWIIYERMIKLILGFGGVLLLLPGILRQKKEADYWFMWSFILGAFLYVLIIARGNLQHDYYQILIIPTVCIILGRGVSYIVSLKIPKLISIGAVVLITFSMLFFSWEVVKDYFNINNRKMVEAGQTANRLLPKNAKIIAPLDGDTSFLYQAHRQGWPAFQNSIEDLTTMGADYLVLQTPSQHDIAKYTARYKTIASNSAVLIVKLK